MTSVRIYEINTNCEHDARVSQTRRGRNIGTLVTIVQVSIEVQIIYGEINIRIDGWGILRPESSTVEIVSGYSIRYRQLSPPDELELERKTKLLARHCSQHLLVCPRSLLAVRFESCESCKCV